MLAAQLSVELVDIPVAPFTGDAPEGVPGLGQDVETAVKRNTDPDVELPQLFLATTFQ